MKRRQFLKLGSAQVGAVAVGTAMASNANANPFSMEEMRTGYQQVAQGACGEGKCGGNKPAMDCDPDMDDNCKAKEGKCGEGSCGGNKSKEGACGEGKCGSKT